MSVKYHLNPDTGDVRICKAFLKPCRFVDEPHSFSKEELREKFEELNSESSLITIRKQPVASAMPIAPVDKNGEQVRVFDSESQENKRLTAFYCKGCSRHLTDEEADIVISWDRIKCSCGMKLAREDADLKDNLGLAVLKKDLWVTDPNTRDGGVLYHATYDTNWHNEIKENPNRLLHIGSQDAAHSRAAELANTGTSPELVLYEIELVETASSSSVLNEDLAEQWDTELKPENEKVKESFHLYINGWEDHGSVSALLTEKHIRIKGREKIKVDMMNSVTSYPDEDFANELAVRESAI